MHEHMCETNEPSITSSNSKDSNDSDKASARVNVVTVHQRAE